MHPWRCRECDSPYDMLAIEMALVEMCNQMMYSYITQDLCCKNCQQIQRSNMDVYCKCSGKWINKEMQAKDVQEVLSIVKQKAQFHGMEWLTETLTNYGI